MAGLASFGSFSRAEVSAMGALVDYLELTQRGKLPLLRAPVREASGGTVQIDAATRRNLELTQALSGGREGSLLAAMDRTVTAAGARLLEVRLSSPSRDLAVISGRLAPPAPRGTGPALLALLQVLAQAFHLRALRGSVEHRDGLGCFAIECLSGNLAFAGLSGDVAIHTEKNNVRTRNPLRPGYHAHGVTPG